MNSILSISLQLQFFFQQFTFFRWVLHILILSIFIFGLKFITRKSRSSFLSEVVTAIRCLEMFLTFINVKKEFQPSTCNFMNDELFQRCFRDNYLRNNAFVLIHIVRKRHFIYKGLFFFLVSRLQFTLKTSVSYLAQRQRFAYFINSQDNFMKYLIIGGIFCLN